MAQQDLQSYINCVGPANLQSYVYGVNLVEIGNFFLDVEQFVTSSSEVYVDLVDYYHQIDTVSGTYFMVDGVVVSGTFTVITVSGSTSAYRMAYDPTDDFSSLDGSTQFKVRAESVKGLASRAEKDYYLTYGYKVEFENMDRKWMDFGYDNQIVVRMEVENLASCPKISADAYWFETKQQQYTDLGVSIKGTYIDGLSASIFPQSTTYFYGKTYRLVVNAKDFSGNEMEPFILVYTIEDKN